MLKKPKTLEYNGIAEPAWIFAKTKKAGIPFRLLILLDRDVQVFLWLPAQYSIGLY